jgi:hypothetical protein
MMNADSSRRTIVHVWNRDGTYVGEVYTDSSMRLEVFGDDEAETKQVKAILTDQATKTDMIELRATDLRRTVEFPGAEWLALASLMLLPSEGYRVHIISDPVRAES